MYKEDTRELYRSTRRILESGFEVDGEERVSDILGEEGYYDLRQEDKRTDHLASTLAIASVTVEEMLEEGTVGDFLESKEEELAENTEKYVSTKNPEKLTKPEIVSLSQVYLTLADSRELEYRDFDTRPVLMEKSEVEDSLLGLTGDLADYLKE